MTKKIRLWLTITLLILTLLPVGVSYVLVRDVVKSSLSAGLTENLSPVLDGYQKSLKKLKKLDKENEPTYRDEFRRTQDLKWISEESQGIKSILNQSLMTYFSAGLALTLSFALIASFYLSRKIARAYDETFVEMNRQKSRATFLAEVSQWQQVAQKLAHEIKNPLTPIELAVTSLPEAKETKNPADFQSQLLEVCNIVTEEVRHLKSMVDNFAQFSRIPKANLKTDDLGSALQEYLQSYQNSWPNVQFEPLVLRRSFPVNLDRGLFRQVLNNLIQNAVEANPGKVVPINFDIELAESQYILRVENGGATIPEDIREKIFSLYFSTKHSGESRGLGLAIVKKIIAEHNGDIMSCKNSSGATFRMTFPYVSEAQIE